MSTEPVTTIVQRHPGLRWLVPALVLALVIGIPAVSQRMASADPGLPPRTAEQLLTDLAQAKPVPLSGTVQQTMNLGLPALPQVVGDGDTSVMGLLTGNHTWRVWTNATDSARVAKVNGSDELTLIHNPRETWLWNSQTREAIRTTHDQQGTDEKKPTEPPATPTPAELAKKILAELDPTTEVTVDSATTVAGRAAYQLVLSPTSADTTVGQVRLAIDAETKLPLRLVLTAKGVTTPAVQIAFTAISFQAPDAALFTFTPPENSTVTDSEDLPTDGPGSEEPGSLPTDKPNPDEVVRTVVGTSWTQVLVVSGLGDLTSSDDPALTELLGQFPTVNGDWGQGRLVRTTLVNAVVTTDGRVAIGAVTPELLYAALR